MNLLTENDIEILDALVKVIEAIDIGKLNKRISFDIATDNLPIVTLHKNEYGEFGLGFYHHFKYRDRINLDSPSELQQDKFRQIQEYLEPVIKSKRNSY